MNHTHCSSFHFFLLDWKFLLVFNLDFIVIVSKELIILTKLSNILLLSLTSKILGGNS